MRKEESENKVISQRVNVREGERESKIEETVKHIKNIFIKKKVTQEPNEKRKSYKC